MKASIPVLLLAALPSLAAADVLRAGPVVVSPSGVVTHAGAAVGRLPLPQQPGHVSQSVVEIDARRVLHVKVLGAAGVAGELVTLLPPDGSPIFSGVTGPQGVDREWRRALDVSAAGVLLYETREDGVQCDGQAALLFPRMYDFARRAFRPVARVPQPEGAITITARRGVAGVPSGDPLNTFHTVFASSQPGDEQSAINLTAPAEVEDGRPDTAWSENRGGAGIGEVLIARAQPAPYRLKALRIIPGDASSRRAFGEANRIKAFDLLLSGSERYRIVFPRDPLADGGTLSEPYWAVLPQPVQSTCATIVIAAVYPGRSARGPAGGRTSISELRFFTELEFNGGVEQLARDLAADNAARGEYAARVLSQLGQRGVEIAQRALEGAGPTLRRRLAELLVRGGQPEAAPVLAKLLPRLERARQRAAADALARSGPSAVAHVVPLLDSDDPVVVELAARVIGRIGGASGRDALLARAGTGQPQRRAAIVEGLARLTDDDSIAAALQALQEPGEPRRLADLVHAIGAMAREREDRRGVAARIAALWEGQARFEARYRIIATVGRLDAAGQLPVLLRAATVQDPILRWMATGQLRKVQSRRSTVALLAALGDPDPRVRSTAAIGLTGRPTSSSIAKHLAARLERERWPMAARVTAEAIGHHCSPRGNAALKTMLQRGKEGVDEIALLSLARCAPPELGLQLLAIIRSDSWRAPLRRRAVELVTPDLAPRHGPELIEIFGDLRRRATTSDHDERVAGALTRAVGLLDSSAATEALADALALDPNESIRAAAAMAVARRCAPAARETLRRAEKDASALVRRAASGALKKCKW